MNSRQFYIMLFILTFSIKVQKLPSIIYNDFGKNSYLIFIVYFLINLILICLAFFILKQMKDESIFKKGGVVSTIAGKIIFSISIVYFLGKALILFEAIQDLFSYILFDNLPWELFSFFLLICVFYLSFAGIKAISLNFDIYVYIIVISIALITILGGIHTDFSVILPFNDVDFGLIGKKFISYNLWFGDFFLILFMGKHSDGIKLWKTLVVYAISMITVCVLVVEFCGIYGPYVGMQASLISEITEQSMLGINIGRADWFLILFTEIGTILSCSVYLYFAKKCLNFVIPKLNTKVLILILFIVFYVLDIFVFVDHKVKVDVFTGVLSYVFYAFKLVSFLLLIFKSLNIYHKNKQNWRKVCLKN